jgi:hypothetical protein
MLTYSIYHDGKELIAEAKSKNDALRIGNIWYAEQDDDLRNGETKTLDVDLVAYDDEGNEVSREQVVLEYEHYHGDLTEHGTY